MEAQYFLILCVQVAISASSPIAESAENSHEGPNQPGQVFPYGDPRNCKPKGFRMEVLPGGGWDNLQNLQMGQVLAMNYTQCKTTADRKFLIPDNTFVVPNKRSRIDMFSRLFDHWSDYKSATSMSVNVEASFFSIVSGSFSTDFMYNKERQVNDRSFTTRVQVRLSLYTIKSQPDAPLHPAFARRLMEIAANMQNNQTELAWYQAQLLVREFGTHYLTSADAGAAVVKEDHIKQNFLKDASKTTFDVKAAASASFFGKVGIKGGTADQTSHETLQQYTGNQTSSRIITHGGPPFVANFSLTDWEKGVENELVAIDKAGDPLHYAITPASLPGLPAPTVRRMATVVEEAIQMYYKVNTVPGCTQSDSPNFHFQANIDDGSCKRLATNFTFGGVYQKCYPVYESAGNLCKQLEQKNPLTGDFTCPVGFEPVLLIRPGGKRPSTSASYHKTQCHNSCTSCGFLWLDECCNTECQNVLHYSQAEYDTYWCAATGDVSQGTGVLFGGVFTKTDPNPITGTKTCPQRFYPMALGSHAFVCISDDYELGYEYSLPFAGFFSCSAGNPLAIPRKAFQALANGSMLRRSPYGVERFLFAKSGYNSGETPGESHGPRHCPNAYSQHLVTVDNQCEINYCVKSGAFNNMQLSPVKRPPFSPRPGVNPSTTEALEVIGVNGKVWVKNSTSGDWELQDFAQRGSDPNKERTSGTLKRALSPGVTAAISVSVTALAGVLVAAIFVGYRRRRQGRRYRGDGLLDSYVEEERKPLNTVAKG